MTPMRTRGWVVVGVAAIALLSAPWMWRWSAPPTAPSVADASAWGRWQRLSIDEQRALVDRYREVSRRADARDILARARRFAELSPHERRLLSELNELRVRVLGESSPMQRAVLLAMSPAGQAAELHRMLAAMEPSPLARLNPPPPQ